MAGSAAGYRRGRRRRSPASSTTICGRSILNDHFVCVGGKSAFRHGAYRFGLYPELVAPPPRRGWRAICSTFVDELPSFWRFAEHLCCELCGPDAARRARLRAAALDDASGAPRSRCAASRLGRYGERRSGRPPLFLQLRRRRLLRRRPARRQLARRPPLRVADADLQPARVSSSGSAKTGATHGSSR